MVNGFGFLQMTLHCWMSDPKTCKNLTKQVEIECGPMPNVMVALPNIGGALCSTPQSFADAHY